MNSNPCLRIEVICPRLCCKLVVKPRPESTFSSFSVWEMVELRKMSNVVDIILLMSYEIIGLTQNKKSS